MTHIEITSDVFDIATALKEIDPQYSICWNTKKKRYEIFYEEYGNAHLELVLPYRELDERTLILVRKTRMEYAKALLQEMEEKNEKLRQQEEQKQLEIATEQYQKIRRVNL